MNRSWHLLRSSFVVALLFGLGKLTGLARTRLVGATFGTGADLDAFTAANQLPEVLVTLMAGGALAAAFIPVYSSYLTGGRPKQALRLANAVLTLVLIVLAAVSALGALLAPWLARFLLVPHFQPQAQRLTAELMRVILIQTTIFGVSSVLSSILNAHQHFALPALAPTALDIGYGVGIFLLVPWLGIRGLAWGTVVGGALHVLIQVPALLRLRFRYRPTLGLESAGLRRIARLMGPRIVALGAVQVADLFIVHLASSLPAGSISGYFYAYYLMQFPETLLGTAIAMVIFPTLAELYNAGDMEGLKNTAMGALGVVWTLTIPAAAALVLMGRPAIAALLQVGAFGRGSAEVVYSVLVFFSLRVVSEATLEILARLFYAQHDTLTPMCASLVWLAIHIALALLLVGRLAIGGLALSSTIAFTFQVALLFLLQRRRLGSLGEKGLALSGGRAVLASAGMSLAIVAVGKALGESWLFLPLGSAVGLLAYLWLNLLLGGKEIPSLARLLLRRAAGGE